MRFLGNLAVGEKFCTAHPRQQSLNGLWMPPNRVFRIVKVYPMSPYTVISKLDGDSSDVVYSLGQRTPVRPPLEPRPTENEVLAFIGVKERRKPVAYRLLWDGKMPLVGILNKGQIAIMNMMFALGRSVYPVSEFPALVDEHLPKFLGKKQRVGGIYLFKWHKVRLIANGLIEEVFGDVPISEEVVAANLQEVINDRSLLGQGDR